MSLSGPKPFLMLTVLTGTAGFMAARSLHQGLMPARQKSAELHAPPQRMTLPEKQRAGGSAEEKWMARARKAAPAEFAALFSEIDVLIPPGSDFDVRTAAQRWILGLWIAQDAEAAAAFVAGQKNDPLGASFGLVLGGTAPGKVAELLSGPYAKSLGRYFQSAVMRALSASDPLEYCRLAEKPDSKSPPRFWAAALAALAEKDPSAAAERWSCRPGEGKDQALLALLQVWTRRDAQAARRWLDELPDDRSRHLAQHAWLATLARTDLAAARKALETMDPGDWVSGKRGGEYQATDGRLAILSATAREDLPGALQLLAKLESGFPSHDNKEEERDELERIIPKPLSAFCDALIEAAAPGMPDSPAALMSALAKWKSDSGLSGATYAQLEEGMLRKVLTRQPSGARLAAALELSRQPLNPETQNLLKNLVATAAMTEPQAALDYANSLTLEQRRIYAPQVFNSISQSSYPDLLARAAALMPVTEWNREAGKKLAASPEASLAAINALPVTPEATAARQGFAQEWALRDPEAAARWAVSHASDGGLAATARGVTQAWASYDDTAASTWASALTPGPARNGAALGLAAGIAVSEPDTAWKWAAAITEPALAAEAYAQVARRWGQDAPPEFREALTGALQAAQLPADDRDRILKTLNVSGDTMPDHLK